MTPRGRLTAKEYAEGILSGDRYMLSRAITLVESELASDNELALKVLSSVMSATGRSLRIGVTGVPGAGKSTLIDVFGKYLTGQGKKVAVLAVDPSSQVTGGSIMGDKTRMELLSQDQHAFIRPSPGGKTLGGIARRTRETVLLCEAAGYDIILIETIGVGQSEAKVYGMVDFFLLILLTGAGDELQAIKKGVIELSDTIVINKSEEKNLADALNMKNDLETAFHYFEDAKKEWKVPILLTSAIEQKGISELWNSIVKYAEVQKNSGRFQEKRKRQNLQWMYETILEKLEEDFYSSEIIKKNISSVERDVLTGNVDAVDAALKLLELYTTR